MDFEPTPKIRFTKSDILGVAEAIKAGKASKMHKLKVKRPSNDRTRSPLNKARCILRQISRNEKYT